MFGQFSTCDLVEFQRLLWSGQQAQQGQQQQTQYANNNQQPATIITGIQQQPGGAIVSSNSNTVVVQNSMPAQRHHNFLNQSSVSFTTQPTTRYIPAPPQNRGVNQSIPQNTILIQQQQPQGQTLFSQSQAIPLDLGKAAQEARIREMVPEFEEQYFIQTSSPQKVITSSGRGNQQVQRPQPHVPTSQAITEHLARSYPQQELIQQHRQRMMEEQAQSKSKKSRLSQNEIYQAAMVEMEIEHNDDEDYEEEAEEEEDEDEYGQDDSDDEYEPEEPVGNSGPWKCGHCHKVYKRKSNFMTHQKTHKQDIQCSICEQVFPNDKKYRKHLKNHQQPQQQHHQQHQQIPQPVATSTPTTTGGSSRKRTSKAKKQDELQAAISSISGNGNNGQTPYQAAQTPWGNLYKCDFCTNHFYSTNDLKIHEQEHLTESTLRCLTCDKPFLREDEFNTHIKTHLTETIWNCAVCKMKFDEYKSYRDHLATHLPVVYKDPPPKPPTPEKSPEELEEEKKSATNENQDDDIVEMACFEDVDSNSPKPSTSAAAKLSEAERLAKSRPPPKHFIGPKRYATGSNMKVTEKGSTRKEIIVKGVNNSTANNKTAEEDDDDDIQIISAPDTPHKPIPLPIRPPNAKALANHRLPVPKLPPKVTKLASKRPHSSSHSSHRSSAPAAMKSSKTPTPTTPKTPVSHNKTKPKPMPKSRQVAAEKLTKSAEPATRGRPPKRVASSKKAVRFQDENDELDDDDIYHTIEAPDPEKNPFQFECIICTAWFPSKATRQQHILKKHCSERSVVIKAIRLEDDPTLDLEVIDDEPEPEEILGDL